MLLDNENLKNVAASYVLCCSIVFIKLAEIVKLCTCTPANDLSKSPPATNVKLKTKEKKLVQKLIYESQAAVSFASSQT